MDDLMLPLPGLSPVLGRAVVARFDGGQLSSDAGVLMLREFERRLGIAERLAASINDPRSQAQVVHDLAGMIRFRMLMIASGYEDGNDASTLRSDPAFKPCPREGGDGARRSPLQRGLGFATNPFAFGELAGSPLAVAHGANIHRPLLCLLHPGAQADRA